MVLPVLDLRPLTWRDQLDILAAYGTDETLENEGKVIFLAKKDPAGEGDIATDPWIKVARFQNDAYVKLVMKNHTELQTERRVERLTDEQFEIRNKNRTIETMARTILVSIGNLTLGKDAVPDTYEGRLKLLRVKDFREMVATHAADIENYRLVAREGAAGN